MKLLIWFMIYDIINLEVIFWGTNMKKNILKGLLIVWLLSVYHIVDIIYGFLVMHCHSRKLYGSEDYVSGTMSLTMILAILILYYEVSKEKK